MTSLMHFREKEGDEGSLSHLVVNNSHGGLQHSIVYKSSCVCCSYFIIMCQPTVHSSDFKIVRM